MSRRVYGRLIMFLAAAMCSILAGPALGEPTYLPGCSPTLPHFCIDAGYFLEASSHIVAVYFQVCNEGLQFVRSKDGYTSSADILVVLLEKLGRNVAGDTYRIRLHSSKYEQTTSVDSCESRLFSFKAKPGDFKLAITVYDGDSRIKSMLEAAIHVPSLTDFPSLSDIALLREGGSQKGVKWPGFSPNVRRIYDVVPGDIPFYYEIYHGDTEDSVVVAYQVLDSVGSVMYEESLISAGKGTATHMGKVPTDSLSNGRYMLKVAIIGSDGKPAAMRSKEFQVMSESLYFGKDVEEAVALLTYIARSSVIDAFVKADTEERKRIWAQFWREKDPTPRTPRNEFYEEHLRRFRYANRHFSVSLSEGWETDRGRIYILYGQPDEVESYGMEMSRNPTEIWYYFERGRRFVFVDQTGFGDYVLVSER